MNRIFGKLGAGSYVSTDAARGEVPRPVEFKDPADRERLITTIERDHAASFDLTIPEVRQNLALWLEARSTDAHWSALAWRAMVNFTPAETREIVLAHYRREE